MSTSVPVSSCCPQSNQDIQNIFLKTPRLSVMATTMLLIYLHHIQIFVNSRRSEMLHGKIDGGFNILSSSNTHTYTVTFSIGRRCRRVQQFKKGKQRQRSSFAFQIVEWEVILSFHRFHARYQAQHPAQSTAPFYISPLLATAWKCDIRQSSSPFMENMVFFQTFISLLQKIVADWNIFAQMNGQRKCSTLDQLSFELDYKGNLSHLTLSTKQEGNAARMTKKIEDARSQLDRNLTHSTLILWWLIPALMSLEPWFRSRTGDIARKRYSDGPNDGI